MSDKAVPFFNPADITSLGGDWVVQSNGITDTNQRVVGLKANGDENVSKLYDGQSNGPVMLECHEETGYLSLPEVGSVGGGYHINSWTLAYQQNGYPQLTLNLHAHDDNTHADGEMNEYSTDLKLPAQFGIPRSIMDDATGAVTQFELVDTDAGMRALTVSLEAQHVDEPNGTGGHLAGENRGGTQKIEVETTKDPSSVTIHADYDETEDGVAKGNTAAETSKFSWIKSIARDA